MMNYETFRRYSGFGQTALGWTTKYTKFCGLPDFQIGIVTYPSLVHTYINIKINKYIYKDKDIYIYIIHIYIHIMCIYIYTLCIYIYTHK
jgi:hypothetical protein